MNFNKNKETNLVFSPIFKIENFIIESYEMKQKQ